MGERANIVVVDEFDVPPLYLYTHWDGPRLGEVLARALSRKQRWNDGSYLARIIFCEMVKGREGDETGYGIATAPPDNQYPYLVVDVARLRVLIGEAGTSSTLRERIKGDEPESFTVVPFADWEQLPAAYDGAQR